MVHEAILDSRQFLALPALFILNAMHRVQHIRAGNSPALVDLVYLCTALNFRSVFIAVAEQKASDVSNTESQW